MLNLCPCASCSFQTSPFLWLKNSKLKMDGPMGVGVWCLDQVAICARGEKELEVVRQLAPDRCHAIVADLSTEKGVKDMGKTLDFWSLELMVAAR